MPTANRRDWSWSIVASFGGAWVALIAACGANGSDVPAQSGSASSHVGTSSSLSGSRGAMSSSTRSSAAPSGGGASASTDAGVDALSGDEDAAPLGDSAVGGDSTVVTGAAPAVTKDDENLLTDAGVTIVSFGGYLNGESFQQDGILSFQGYQYAAFWNVSRHVVIGRRPLPAGAWSTIELTDYTNGEGDAHNTISLGICPQDGTLHLSFDHHVSTLHYRKSIPGLVTNPSAVSWTASSFSAVSDSLVGNTAIGSVTYPRFLTEPDGHKMLFETRIGGSGNGDEYLWEYDGATHAWTSLGKYVDGTTANISAYPHGLSYGRGGSTRLHMAWCWRDTTNASTNHDLLYIYSDDNGRTWKNNAGAAVGTTGSSFVATTSTGIKVWSIPQNRGLLNSEHMAVDAAGRVHVLLSHMPDSQADDANFNSARSKSEYFSYLRGTDGTWTRASLGLPSIALFRGKLAISSTDDLYAVLPDLRIAATSPASNFSTWALLNSADSGRFFSDPLIDTARLASDGRLSIFYPAKSSPDIFVLDYTLH